MVSHCFLGSIMILHCLMSLQALPTCVGPHKTSTTTLVYTESTPIVDQSTTTTTTDSISTVHENLTTKSPPNEEQIGTTEKHEQTTNVNTDKTTEIETNNYNNSSEEIDNAKHSNEEIDGSHTSTTPKTVPTNNTPKVANSTDTPATKVDNKLISNIEKILSEIDTEVINDITNIIKGDITPHDIRKVLQSLDIIGIFGNNNPIVVSSAEQSAQNNDNILPNAQTFSKNIGDIFKQILSVNDLIEVNNDTNKIKKAKRNVNDLGNISTEKIDIDSENTKKIESTEHPVINNIDATTMVVTITEENSPDNIVKNDVTTVETTQITTTESKPHKNNDFSDTNESYKNVLTIINSGNIYNANANVTLQGHNFIINNLTIASDIIFSKIANANVSESLSDLISTNFKKSDLKLFGKKGKKKLIKGIVKSISDSMIVIVNTGTINGLTLNLPRPAKCTEKNANKQIDNEITTTTEDLTTKNTDVNTNNESTTKVLHEEVIRNSLNTTSVNIIHNNEEITTASNDLTTENTFSNQNVKLTTPNSQDIELDISVIRKSFNTIPNIEEISTTNRDLTNIKTELNPNYETTTPISHEKDVNINVNSKNIDTTPNAKQITTISDGFTFKNTESLINEITIQDSHQEDVKISANSKNISTEPITTNGALTTESTNLSPNVETTNTEISTTSKHDLTTVFNPNDESTTPITHEDDSLIKIIKNIISIEPGIETLTKTNKHIESSTLSKEEYNTIEITTTDNGTAKNNEKTTHDKSCNCKKKRVKRDLELKNLEIPILGTLRSASDGDNIKALIDYIKDILGQGSSQSFTRRVNKEDGTSAIVNSKF